MVLFDENVSLENRTRTFCAAYVQCLHQKELTEKRIKPEISYTIGQPFTLMFILGSFLHKTQLN